MDIDWDAIAEDADYSPRSVLAEVLAGADDIEKVIVVILAKDEGLYSARSNMDFYELIGLLDAAKYQRLAISGLGGDA